MGVISASSRSSGNSEEDADAATWARLGLAPLMATLLLPIIIGVIVLLKCVFNSCCFRKTTTKEEMYGLEGRMTMLPNPDTSFVASNNSNHPPLQERSNSSSLSPATSLLGVTASSQSEKLKTAKVLINNNHPIISVTGDYHLATTDPSQQQQLPIPNADSDLTDTLKRATTGKRQLPDLPQIPLEQLGHPPRRSSSVLSHDGTSELYATVGEVPNPPSRSGIINPYAHLMNRQNSNSNSSKPSTSRGAKDGETVGQLKSNIEPTPSSDSETYATSNHPYAKLKRNPSEHPYARVRNSSLANDEETDTDNYDLPQPYAQRGRQNGGSVPNSQPGSNPPSASSSSSANAVDGPVPPRRIGRQWRRGSHPQGGQQSNDSTQHFSGDSQDSRGYTSISVREPLSNIRSQVVRQDSHYATVSDDSEEMYAAIDDASEGNYMQIPDGASRPSWLDAANVASPIPERREANSPLPPVPAVPPPETPGVPGAVPPTSPLLTSQAEIIPPVYAQVTKKSKKGKAPVTPTASNASTSSQIQDTVEPEIISPDPEIIIRPIPPIVSNVTSHHSHQHHHQSHHRSKSRTLMDNSNLLEAGISEPRRWSKADISYSEFEVVREGLVPLDLKSPNKLSSSTERQERTISPRESITSKKSLNEELVDEDNYNVIPDKHEEGRISRTSKRSSGGGGGGGSKSKSRRERVDSDNYQEIEPISNTYQEIGGGIESSDHYQEIGIGSLALANGDVDDDDDGGSGLYQEIRKKDDYEEEEDDDDQLYEKVKPSSSKSQLAVPGRHTLERKHGYEKIKRKPQATSPQRKVNGGSDDEDDEEDEETKPEEDDDMYERVKYPPYERLKESRSDLAVDAVVDDEDNDFYEHIGYSRVKPKNKPKKPVEEVKHQEEEIDLTGDMVDVNQLYAVVDKTKKKKNTSTTTSNMNSSSNNNNNNPIVESNLSSFSVVDHHGPPGRESTMSTTRSSNSRNEGSPRSKPELSAVNAVSDLNFIDDSIDIEYI